MIESFWIENFKAFGARQTIPLKKITLLFGANSAGKSSLLQALLLLKQSTQEIEDAQSALLPKGNLVDLGSVGEMTFRHDTSLPLRFGFTSEVRARRGESPLAEAVSGTFGFASSGRRGLVLKDLTVEEDGAPILRLSRTSTRASASTLFDRRAVMFAGELLNHDARLVHEAYRRHVLRLDLLMQRISAHDEKKIKTEMRWLMPLFQSVVDDASTRMIDSPQEFAQFIENGIQARIEKLKHYDEETFVSDLSISLGNAVVSGVGLRLRSHRDEPSAVHRPDISPDADLLSMVGQFTASVTRQLQRIGYVGPYRATPDRLYIFQGIEPRDVGRSGQNLPHLLYKRPPLVKALNDWFTRMEVGYRLDIRKTRAADIEGVFSLRMHDPYIRSTVSWADVGFGISQLLPILVQAVMAENRLVLVEQPELHLHPRLQAEFGSVLAEAIKLENANRFLIETHSEHLILRLQRLIRRGELSADDVSVVHVRRSPEGSIARVLRMDEKGDFVDRWPAGFFEEGFVERFAD